MNSSPVDTLNDLPPLPRRTPVPRRSWWYALLLVCVLLVANALVGDRGLLALFRANQEHAQLQAAIDAIRTENAQLHGYVRALHNEPLLVEDLARQQLGLIKEGEQVFIVRTVDEPTERALPTTDLDEGSAADVPSPQQP